MECDTLEVLEGSILTFEAVAKLSKHIIGLNRFAFNDYLQTGLEIPNHLQTVKAYFSADNGITYTLFNNPTLLYYLSPFGYYLGVTIASTDIVSYPILIKITFPVKIYDLNKFLTANITSKNPKPTLTNTGTFYAQYKNTDIIGKAVDVILDAIPIEEYSLKVSGYSINICPTTNNFNAKLCFNCINSKYTGTSINNSVNYILTLKSTNGIYFDSTITKDDIRISTSCCGKNNQEIFDFSIDTTKLTTDGLIIIIPYKTEADSTTNPPIINMCGKSILISIPYNIDATSSCNLKSIPIEGSIEFTDGTNTLAKLNNFIFYVNVDCGNLIGIGKSVLC